MISRPSGSETGGGVSVVICTRNGAGRIAPTLEHLSRQVCETPWEVILVDNGSADGTEKLARELWPADAPAPIRILCERKPGYNAAVERGMAAARHGIIAQVHDDNWAAPDWIARVEGIFREHPEVGACGGRLEAVCEIEPPGWFFYLKENYAVGRQMEETGDLTWSRGFLWGAGLCVRRTAWQALKEAGFRFGSTGRRSRGRLISGEDSELCMALRLAGWKLWYDDALRMEHFIPAARLQWSYLRRLFRSFGESSAVCDRYCHPVLHGAAIPANLWQTAFWETWDKIEVSKVEWREYFEESEGKWEVLELEQLIGRLRKLFAMRLTYARGHREVLAAKWNVYARGGRLMPD